VQCIACVNPVKAGNSLGRATAACGWVGRQACVSASHGRQVVATEDRPKVCVIKPLTEMSTRNIKIILFLGSKVRRVRKADNLTAIYEPIV
jgi:hypothetical protein